MSGPTYTISADVTFETISGGHLYLFAGDGQDRVYPPGAASVAHGPQYLLYAGFDVEGPLISPRGTTVTLRNPDGRVVDQQTVTPINGTAPFVPTPAYVDAYLNHSLESLAEVQAATPFALRAPTSLPAAYRFEAVRLYPPGYNYRLIYSRSAANRTADIRVTVIAPHAVNESDRPAGSRPVTVGDRTGHYATQNSDGVLQFVGPDGWGYYMRGPSNESRLIRIGASMEALEDA